MMKLGEALTQRARQAQKLNDLQERIRVAVLVQEGDDPQEDANALIDEYVRVSNDHALLVARIATTNAETNVTGVSDGQTLLTLLHQREALIRERNICRAAATSAVPGKNSLFRYSRSEVKFVATVDVQALRAKEAELDQRISTIDARVQKLNWDTELL